MTKHIDLDIEGNDPELIVVEHTGTLEEFLADMEKMRRRAALEIAEAIARGEELLERDFVDCATCEEWRERTVEVERRWRVSDADLRVRILELECEGLTSNILKGQVRKLLLAYATPREEPGQTYELSYPQLVRELWKLIGTEERHAAE